jgi:hypothetical protein
MESDALLILVLSVLVWQHDKAGAWVLLGGLMRYAFVAAAWAWPWLGGPLRSTLRGKTVAVAFIAGLARRACADRAPAAQRDGGRARAVGPVVVVRRGHLVAHGRREGGVMRYRTTGAEITGAGMRVLSVALGVFILLMGDGQDRLAGRQRAVDRAAQEWRDAARR